jgi:hypothetical protein
MLGNLCESSCLDVKAPLNEKIHVSTMVYIPKYLYHGLLFSIPEHFDQSSHTQKQIKNFLPPKIQFQTQMGRGEQQ